MLDHDPGVGGRFSVLTNVGLLPAAMLGLDIAAMREGAALALAPVLAKKKAAEVPAALGAALAVALAESKGKSISVLMAYADRLERFTHWYVQLWAESLGKNGKGTTPVAALGPVDQHSQVQLFIGGPRDKLFTVVTVAGAGRGPRIDGELAKLAGEPAFGGKTIGDLVAAEGRATAETLAKNGCPVRTIHLAAARRGEPRRTADAFHAGDHHRRAPARRRCLRPAGGGRGQGAGEEVFGRRLSGRMIRVTDTISIDDSELSESFVRSSGPGGQNVNKVSSAVQLRFDVRHSPSLPNDVAVRLMRLAGKRLTKDGVIVIIAQSHRDQERNRADARERLFDADPPGGGAAGAAPRHQGAQGRRNESGSRAKSTAPPSKACAAASRRLNSGGSWRLCLAGATLRR